MRVNIATATATTRAAIIGKTTTVKLWDGKRTGVVESVNGSRVVVRFPDGKWAYSDHRITVR